MTRSSFKERQWQQREQEIISCAGTLIQQFGIERVSLDMLAAEVGISKPTLYQHFRSKDELLTHVISLGIKAIEGLLHRPDTHTELRTLEMVFRTLLKLNFEKGTLMAAVGADAIMTVLDDPRIKSQKRQLMELLVELVRKAQHNGDINPQLEAHGIVYSMFALLAGVRRLLHENPEADFNATIETVLTLFMSGIRQTSVSA